MAFTKYFQKRLFQRKKDIFKKQPGPHALAHKSSRVIFWQKIICRKNTNRHNIDNIYPYLIKEKYHTNDITHCDVSEDYSFYSSSKKKSRKITNFY